MFNIIMSVISISLFVFAVVDAFRYQEFLEVKTND